jgi:hypothetical protein
MVNVKQVKCSKSSWVYLELVLKTRFYSPNSRSYFENLLFQHFVHNKFRALTQNIFLRLTSNRINSTCNIIFLVCSKQK